MWYEFPIIIKKKPAFVSSTFSLEWNRWSSIKSSLVWFLTAIYNKQEYNINNYHHHHDLSFSHIPFISNTCELLTQSLIINSIYKDTCTSICHVLIIAVRFLQNAIHIAVSVRWPHRFVQCGGTAMICNIVYWRFHQSSHGGGQNHLITYCKYIWCIYALSGGSSRAFIGVVSLTFSTRNVHKYSFSWWPFTLVISCRLSHFCLNIRS